MIRAWSFSCLLLSALLFGAAAPSMATAQTAPGGIDQAVVDKALDYLNRTRTLKARFVQRDNAGGRWTGQIWMSRPGRLRFHYDPPQSDVIWTNQNLVKHYDASLESVTHLPRDVTPAWFLLDDRVEIKDDVRLLETQVRPSRYFVAAARTGILTEARVTLAFQRDPERILGWTVTDDQGAVTQVDLVELETGIDIPEDVFEYTPPVAPAHDR